MASTTSRELHQVREALSELDALSKDEYGIGLEQLLRDQSPMASIRLQRLTGIVLKREFAEPGGRPAQSLTGASRSWPWKKTSPEESAASAPREFQILSQLRMPGPWNKRKPGSGALPISWDNLQSDADEERSLFKMLALYVDDKFNEKHTKTMREYIAADESAGLEAGLDLATSVVDLTVTAPLIALLGVPTLAVGIALIGARYGYRKLTEDNDPGDRAN
jgi:hypothetical protein